MRVALAVYSYPPNLSGASNVAVQLERGLERLGHEVHVLHPGQGRGCPTCRAARARHRPTRSFTPPVGQLGQRFAIPAGLQGWTGRVLDDIAPDVVHALNGFNLGGAALRWAQRRGVASVATAHLLPANLTGMHPILRPLSPVIAGLVGRATARGHLRATAVTAPSAFARDTAAGGGRTDIEIVTNGVDTAHFTPGDTHVARLSSVALRLLFVGRTQAEKRVDLLISAMEHEQRIDGLTLTIVGGGPQLPAIGRMVRKRRLEHCINVLGTVPDDQLLRLYREHDVLCMPSPVELQGLAVLEGMSCGLPVLAADAGALPELVRHGITGLLHTPGSVASFRDQVQLLRDDSFRHGMSHRCRSFVRDQHDLSIAHTQMEAVYRRAIAATTLS